ncbi:uncharacterized protein LOC120846535 [Ixodes scapularis]|uniref:uncharacterized protein LOC120846535 n=1 Tax=Ixodes scapularis TaxID=6945 RepID=UPI001C38742A|nr:uncharacterized protein LOC120846535 [Ixodes scapularis]
MIRLQFARHLHQTLRRLFLAGMLVNVTPLKLINLEVPRAPKEGDSWQLHCRYELEDDVHYVTKWYKDGKEFFRFDESGGKVFPVVGVNVDVSQALPSSPSCYNPQNSEKRAPQSAASQHLVAEKGNFGQAVSLICLKIGSRHRYSTVVFTRGCHSELRRRFEFLEAQVSQQMIDSKHKAQQKHVVFSEESGDIP